MNRRALIDEIKQVVIQYEAEVGRVKKPWPKSVKERIRRLLESGMKSKQISEETSVPYYTVLKWRPIKPKKRNRHNEFQEISVSQSQLPYDPNSPVVAQKLAHALRGEEPRPKLTVTVATFDGFKIDLPSIDEAVELIIRFRQLGG